MKTAEEQLAEIGFGRARREPACWRAMRLGPAWTGDRGVESDLEPSCSRSLLRWRDLLAQGPHRSPYRISRAG